MGHILAAGCDRRVVLYSREGRVVRQFDYSRDDTEKEFTVACCSPSGQAVAVGSFDRYILGDEIQLKLLSLLFHTSSSKKRISNKNS
jgi:hypothetical protein